MLLVVVGYTWSEKRYRGLMGIGTRYWTAFICFLERTRGTISVPGNINNQFTHNAVNVLERMVKSRVFTLSLFHCT